MKINLSKIWNVFFHALIVCTLLLCLFMMTKYFFFKDNKSLELGNLSDWVSSLSTFGTLVVAYKAFKAAPNWLSQKFDEESLKTGLAINNIIKVEYTHEIKKINNHINNNIISTEVNLLHYHNTLIHPDRIDIVSKSFVRINSYLSINFIVDISHITRKLENEITKLNMTEWHIRLEKNTTINSIHQKIEQLRKYEREYKALISTIFDHTNSGLFVYKTQKNEIDNLLSIHETLVSLENTKKTLTREISECINEYGSTKSFRSYFHRIIE